MNLLEEKDDQNKWMLTRICLWPSKIKMEVCEEILEKTWNSRKEEMGNLEWRIDITSNSGWRIELTEKKEEQELCYAYLWSS